MSLTALQIDDKPGPSARVVSLGIEPRTAPAAPFRLRFGGIAGRVLPPLVTLAFVLILWEVFCSSPTSSLPPPSRVISDIRCSEVFSIPFVAEMTQTRSGRFGSMVLRIPR